MISSSPDSTVTRKRLGGFTLTELMIGVAIGSFILAGVLSTFLMVVRSGMRSTNYSAMEAETRRAFEQLGIDARMANEFSATFNGGQITSFTLTIPNTDLTATTQVTYGYDTSDSANKKIFVVPGNDPTATAGRRDLIGKVEDMRFLRYDTSSTLIPASTTSSTGVKHIQISVSVKRVGVGLAATTQIIRSSAFTLRNISI
jgi:prepilin-type N-terminal cleavage/methylation domain-containing protein